MPVQEKLPPLNLEAEQSVLGSCIQDPEALHKTLALLTPDDFYIQAHRTIYETMLRLETEGYAVDFITVSDDLRTHHLLDACGGLAYLCQINEFVPHTGNVLYYANIVVRDSVMRHLRKTGDDLHQWATEIGPSLNGTAFDAASSLIDHASTEVFRLAHHADAQHLKWPETVQTIYETIANRKADNPLLDGAITTGIPGLDYLIGGFTEEEMTVVAARPHVGKTALALSIAYHVARHHDVLLFSLEQPAEQIAYRLFSIATGISARSLQRDPFSEDMATLARLGEAFDRISSLRLTIAPTPVLSVSLLRRMTREWRSQHQGLVILDYLNLLQVPGMKEDNPTTYTTAAIKAVKSIARECRSPIMVLAQLNRNIENRADPKPRLSDLRDTGAIEAAADRVFMIYRPDKDEETIEDEDAFVIIPKDRITGSTGEVPLRFHRQSGFFFDR